MNKMTKAELQYAAQDAYEAMRLAMEDGRREAMSKYAAQYNAYEAELNARFGRSSSFKMN